MATPSPSEWWQSFFHGPITEFWRRVGDPAMTAREADGVAQSLGLVPGMRVLDVPCGNGRHALALAARGMRVHGVDLTEEYVDEAQRGARERGLDASFAQGDMRAVAAAESFAAAYCLGNSFGYFEDDAEHARFLRAVARALAPGAPFLLDAICLESVLQHVQPHREFTLGDLTMRIATSYDHGRGRVVSTYGFVRAGEALGAPSTASYRAFTFRQLVELLGECGFVGIAGLAGLDGTPFAHGAQRLYLTARRGRPPQSACRPLQSDPSRRSP